MGRVREGRERSVVVYGGEARTEWQGSLMIEGRGKGNEREEGKEGLQKKGCFDNHPSAEIIA